MTKTERQRLQQDFYEAAMRGAKLLDDRTNFGWVNKVRPRTFRGMSTLDQVNQARTNNGGWTARPGEVRYPGMHEEINGGYYGFYTSDLMRPEGVGHDPEAEERILNDAWRKVVTRRQYLRDLRRRRKMGLTPGTRLTMMKTDGRVEASL